MDETKSLHELAELYPKLSDKQIARLSHIGIHRSFPAGQIIFDQGTVGRYFYVVLQGALEVVLPSREGESHVRLAQPGDFTGGLNMLSGRPSLVRARTVEATELLEIDSVISNNSILLKTRALTRSSVGKPAMSKLALRRRRVPMGGALASVMVEAQCEAGATNARRVLGTVKRKACLIAPDATSS